MNDKPQTLCRACVTPIGYIDAPTGGWWAHDTHPDDGHDAVPGAWMDGDDLMEAIAAAVHEHCETGISGIVHDDPRNIAGTAAAVVRRVQPAAVSVAAASRADDALRDRIAEALAEKFTPDGKPYQSMRVAFQAPDGWPATRMVTADEAADAIMPVLPPAADRAPVLLWAADQIDAETRRLKADEVLEPDRFRPCRDASAQLRRLAAETQQQPETHVYLSTGCYHGDHAYCQSMTGLAGAKRPAECKKCGANCICSCHAEGPRP